LGGQKRGEKKANDSSAIGAIGTEGKGRKGGGKESQRVLIRRDKKGGGRGGSPVFEFGTHVYALLGEIPAQRRGKGKKTAKSSTLFFDLRRRHIKKTKRRKGEKRGAGHAGCRSARAFYVMDRGTKKRKKKGEKANFVLLSSRAGGKGGVLLFRQEEKRKKRREPHYHTNPCSEKGRKKRKEKRGRGKAGSSLPTILFVPAFDDRKEKKEEKGGGEGDFKWIKQPPARNQAFPNGKQMEKKGGEKKRKEERTS